MQSPCPCSSPCMHLAPGSATWPFCRPGDVVPCEASICGSPGKAGHSSVRVVEERVRTFRGQGHALPSVSPPSVSSLKSTSRVVVNLQYWYLFRETWQRREFRKSWHFDLHLAMLQGPEGFNFLQKQYYSVFSSLQDMVGSQW